MRRPTPIATRFWSKVEKTEGCWLWVGAKGRLGYGNIEYSGRCFSAHRIAYEMLVGVIPAGMEVCHRCDNRACIRPEHLFLGTHKENMADAVAKGRMVFAEPMLGENNHASRLFGRDIHYIRGLGKIGFTQREVSKMYGVSQVTVGKIQRREAWNHIP